MAGENENFGNSPKASEESESALCAVCGDSGAKKRYGIMECRGCESFFWRCVTNQLTYKCFFGNNCKLEKTQRKYCRSCRYHKCVAVGMKVEKMKVDQLSNRAKTIVKANATAMKILKKISQDEPEASLSEEPLPKQHPQEEPHSGAEKRGQVVEQSKTSKQLQIGINEPDQMAIMEGQILGELIMMQNQAKRWKPAESIIPVVQENKEAELTVKSVLEAQLIMALYQKLIATPEIPGPNNQRPSELSDNETVEKHEQKMAASFSQKWTEYMSNPIRSFRQFLDEIQNNPLDTDTLGNQKDVRGN